MTVYWHYEGPEASPVWDTHDNNHERVGTLASQVDPALASLISDLKERGYSQTGLYDPPGVGGTHVMYVLHHADKPELYHGLPNNPKIDEAVAIWKGWFKPFSLAGIALTASMAATMTTILDMMFAPQR